MLDLLRLQDSGDLNLDERGLRQLQPPSLISGTFRQKYLNRCISVHIPAYFTFCSLSKTIRKALQTSMF